MAAWQTPIYASGDFTGNGAMTWTVDSADRETVRYQLVDTTMRLAFHISSSTVAGTPNTDLQIKIPAGKTCSMTVATAIYVNDNGTRSIGWATAVSGEMVIRCRLINTGNWAAATNTTGVFGQLLLEVS